MDSIHILYVDDDSRYIDLVRDRFARGETPVTITAASTGREGLERYLADRQDFDCIVTDHQPPTIEAIEFLRSVRSVDPDVPFVLSTGDGGESLASAAISAGATDYLPNVERGEDFTLLANRLENYVDRYRTIREREEVYQALETATEGIGLLDDSGHYLYLNDAYASLYGYDRSTLIGEHWERLYPADEISRFDEDILPALHERGSWRGWSMGEDRYGNTFPEALSLTQLDSGGHVCVVRDISERVESERQFESLVANLQGIFYRCAADLPWVMERVYGDVEAVLGYDSVGLESGEVTWADVMHSGDHERIRESIRTSLARDGTFEVEYRVIGPDGDIRWVMDRGRGVYDSDDALIALEGLATDVTDRRRRQGELEWKTAAMDAAPVGIVISDPDQAGNPITYANDYFCRLTGYPEADIVDQGWRFFQGPLTSEEPIDELREAIETVRPTEVELLNYRRDGTPFWNHIQLTPVFDESGEPTHFVSFQQDVTERVEHERRIAVLHHVILHNIRNNLNVTVGYLDHLETEGTIEDDTLETVRSPAQDLLDTSEKARQIEATLESSSFQPAEKPLDRVIDRVLDPDHFAFDRSRVDIDIDESVSIVAPDSIILAVRELVENACKHARTSTQTVTVSTTETPTSVPTDQFEEEPVTLVIADENQPITDLDRRRLYGDEESPVHHGSGLGLWLVNWVVTMSGGVVSHTSPESGGNRISLSVIRAE